MSENGLNTTEEAPETLSLLTKEAYQTTKELLEAAGLHAGEILVVGCSTSEVAGERIGSYSSPQMAEAVFSGVYHAAQEKNVFLAAQCCEHLNRALILEREAADKYGYEPVNVIPQPKAGGSFATSAYRHFENPTAVEHIRAHAGIDIGDTLIGMHLREVAVPVRISQKTIGSAHVVCARTRLKFVGGSRAVYDENLL
ncbi:MAG: TIGR01440 family protein [Lachnospiraceae bacterium]|nr:TIGR01440 family protein [Lachnospiraceae bacterium]